MFSVVDHQFCHTAVDADILAGNESRFIGAEMTDAANFSSVSLSPTSPQLSFPLPYRSQLPVLLQDLKALIDVVTEDFLHLLEFLFLMEILQNCLKFFLPVAGDK